MVFLQSVPVTPPYEQEMLRYRKTNCKQIRELGGAKRNFIPKSKLTRPRGVSRWRIATSLSSWWGSSSSEEEISDLLCEAVSNESPQPFCCRLATEARKEIAKRQWVACDALRSFESTDEDEADVDGNGKLKTLN